MAKHSSSSGLFLIVAAAALGYAAIVLPPAISESYEKIHRVNPDLALAYLGLVGLLGLLLAGFILYKSVQMWRRSRRKAKPQKLPSKMTAPQIEREIAERHSEAAGYVDAVTGAERELLNTRLEAERS